MRNGQTKRQRKVKGVLANKRLAELRATALASTISELRTAGFVSIGAIVGELNRRRVSTARGGKWHRTSVSRLLDRLKN